LRLTVYGERQNAKVTGNRFTSRFIEPGLISYEDHGGDKELLTKETLDTFTATFVGKPLIIRHNGKTTEGTITRVWWNPDDAWYWCEGEIQGTEARQRINEGWSVSCAYGITDTNETGGEWHAMPYARQILAFEGEHLALVENPRYEGASIRLNEKTKPGTAMFKFIKKILAPTPASAADVKPGQADQADLSGESEVTIDGAQVRLNDLVELHRQRAKGETLAPETQIEVDGKAVTIAAVVAGFRANAAAEDKAKKDKDDEDEKKKKDKEESDRKNATEEEEKKKKEKEDKDRENARVASGQQSFRVLANARNNPPAPQPAASPSFGGLAEQLERGKRLCSLSTGKN